MKGKKIDTNFISQFISECVTKNIISSEEMVEVAKKKISSIDDKIKEVERLKIVRSKLLDVIFTFDKPVKNIKEDNKLLSFYKIQNQIIAKVICATIKEQTININNLSYEKFPRSDIIFCVKQLLENKVISRNENLLSKGDMFNDYCKFISKEV